MSGQLPGHQRRHRPRTSRAAQLVAIHLGDDLHDAPVDRVALTSQLRQLLEQHLETLGGPTSRGWRCDRSHDPIIAATSDKLGARSSLVNAGSVDAMAGPDNQHLAKMRKEYGSKERDGSPDLDVDWLDDGWLALLRKWLGDAERGGVAEPNAMVLATVSEGRPVSRSVLCKGVDEDGIVFFTNYDSAKGEQLAETPYASATFPWYLLNRQFHIRGPVTKVEPEATESYWNNGRAARSSARGLAPVEADRLARRAGRPTGRGDQSLRRRRASSGTAELGWVSHRPRQSSSGRAEKTGCTTEFVSSAGASNACSLRVRARRTG